MLKLPSPQWNKTGLLKEMGITFSLYNEIMNYDPVSVADKIRKPTPEKLKAFIAKHGHVLEKKNETVHLLNGKPVDELNPPVEEENPPNHQEIEYKPPISVLNGEEDLLATLNNLTDRFRKKGYRLSTRIENIFTPEFQES